MSHDQIQQPPTRVLDGHVLPAPGVWDIDPGHTDLAFVGRHFMVTKVRGRFTDVTGRVVIAPQMSDSSVEVTIGMASVESGRELNRLLQLDREVRGCGACRE